MPTEERIRTIPQPNGKNPSYAPCLLGGLSWHAQQVAPYIAAEVGLLFPVHQVNQKNPSLLKVVDALLGVRSLSCALGDHPGGSEMRSFVNDKHEVDMFFGFRVDPMTHVGANGGEFRRQGLEGSEVPTLGLPQSSTSFRVRSSTPLRFQACITRFG